MDQLSAMRVFTAVVDAGSFIGAARSLNMPNSTVTHLIQGLEAHLKTKLFNRTTRRVVVTIEGAAYYEVASRLVKDIDALDAQIRDAGAAPAGRLRVEMTGGIAEKVIIPALPGFMAKYPDIRLELGISDGSVDYVSRSVDCAIRAHPPADEGLIARRLATYGFVTCASPAYLQRYGRPEHPANLDLHHQLISYFIDSRGSGQVFSYRRQSETIELTPSNPLFINDARALSQAIRHGLGVAQVSRLLIQNELDSGAVEEVLSDWGQPSSDLFVVYLPTHYMSSKVSVFINWLTTIFECNTLRATRSP